MFLVDLVFTPILADLVDFTNCRDALKIVEAFHGMKNCI